jgi:predicted glycosyltransferase
MIRITERPGVRVGGDHDAVAMASTGAQSGRGTVWFDFENTPHVLFLEPIIRRLHAEGFDWLATARRHAQTLGLASQRRLPVHPVGAGDRAGLVGKVSRLLGRSWHLARWVAGRSPRLLVSCSRSASLAAQWWRIPAVALLDYEHAEQYVLAATSDVMWFPDVIRAEALPALTRRVARFYPGLKENLYLDEWPVDRGATRRSMGIHGGAYLVVTRPPADTAYYASRHGLRPWESAVRVLASRRDVTVVVVPRTPGQAAALRGRLDGWGDCRVLDAVVDGPALVGAADLVVGGGGTMNREAAVLGVPVWSVFTGPVAQIDEQLAREGRLRWVRTAEELDRALAAVPQERLSRRGPVPEGLKRIVEDLGERLAVRNGATDAP